MNPAQFKAWRKSLGFKQREAAEKLGLKKRMIQYYETGRRDGQEVEIPKSVRLACYALSAGVGDFDGGASLTIPPVNDSGPGEGYPNNARSRKKAVTTS